MRKFGLCSLLVMSMAAIGCGDDDSTAVDAAVINPDAETPVEYDAGTPPVGDVEDFGDCAEDTDCANPDSECVPIGFLQGTPRVCMPVCNGTDDCPMDTVCYPTGGGNWGPNAALMGDHCWFSLCGEFFGGITGGTGQSCTLGADSGVSPADQLAGWCYPFEDGDFGQCLEAGDLPPGSTCDFDFDTRVRGGANCDATGLCIGQTGMATGTCGQICDPREILSGGADCTAVVDTDCQDSSSISTSATDGSVSRATIAFCTDIVACGTIEGSPDCPVDDAGVAQGCLPSNPLRATGLCDITGTGALAVNATCSFDATTDAQECGAGTLCIGDGTTNNCRAYCKMAPRTCTAAGDCNPSQTCEALPTGGMGCVAADYQTTPSVDCATIDPTYTCQRVGWDNGFDDLPGTADDNSTEDWGACMPPP